MDCRKSLSNKSQPNTQVRGRSLADTTGYDDVCNFLLSNRHPSKSLPTNPMLTIRQNGTAKEKQLKQQQHGNDEVIHEDVNSTGLI